MKRVCRVCRKPHNRRDGMTCGDCKKVEGVKERERQRQEAIRMAKLSRRGWMS